MPINTPLVKYMYVIILIVIKYNHTFGLKVKFIIISK